MSVLWHLYIYKNKIFNNENVSTAPGTCWIEFQIILVFFHFVLVNILSPLDSPHLSKLKCAPCERKRDYNSLSIVTSWIRDSKRIYSKWQLILIERNPDPLIILRKDRRWSFPFHTCTRFCHNIYFFARNMWFHHHQLSALTHKKKRTDERQKWSEKKS